MSYLNPSSILEAVKGKPLLRNRLGSTTKDLMVDFLHTVWVSNLYKKMVVNFDYEKDQQSPILND